MDGTVKVWDLESGRMSMTLKAHQAFVYVQDVAITGDGRYVISAAFDSANHPSGAREDVLKVWDLNRGSDSSMFIGHSDQVMAVAVSTDGKRVASASWDHTIKIWDLESGRELQTLKGHTNIVNAVAISPNGQMLLSACNGGTVKLWDLERGQEIHDFGRKHGAVRAMVITADGRRAVTVANDLVGEKWDLTTGASSRTSGLIRSLLYAIDARRIGRLLMPINLCELLCLTPNGRHMVLAAKSKLTVWNIGTTTALHTMEGHTDEITALAAAPDGKWLVSASKDQSVRVWNLENGQELRRLTVKTRAVEAIAVSPNGMLLAVGSGDATVKVLDLKSDAVLAEFTGEGTINCCAWAPDGRTIIAGEASGRLHFLRLVLPHDPVEAAWNHNFGATSQAPSPGCSSSENSEAQNFGS
jgi:WD40 repeat protein